MLFVPLGGKVQFILQSFKLVAVHLGTACAKSEGYGTLRQVHGNVELNKGRVDVRGGYQTVVIYQPLVLALVFVVVELTCRIVAVEYELAVFRVERLRQLGVHEDRNFLTLGEGGLVNYLVVDDVGDGLICNFLRFCENGLEVLSACF